MSDELARVINLRDLGGHRAAGGLVVRRGRIYRSAALSALDGTTLAAVRALGLRTVVDLRQNAERAAHPTPWEEIGCTDYWCRDHEESGADLGLRLRDPALTAEDSRAFMADLYGTLPYVQAESYARLFRALGEDRGPVLFHCAVGKDRTGVAAALILGALGVARETIVDDYAATARFDLLASPHARDNSVLGDTGRAAIAPLLTAEAAYLAAMFAAVETQSGSIDAYLRATLGLTDAEIEAFRDRSLGPD